MRISDFDYSLPNELIARHPPARRRDSRVLELNPVCQSMADRQFSELPSLLEPNDLLVLNNTRVIPARLEGRKATGGKAEVLIERILEPSKAVVMIRASKSPKPGTELEFAGGVRATVTERRQDLFVLEFSTDIAPYLDQFGTVPLPPYLERAAEEADRERYQCVFARHAGAVAAPTAGLHFDTAMLEQLKEAGIEHCFVTLHVGAGTFQSLRDDDLAANRLHSERVSVEQATCDAVKHTRDNGGRVVAVGTTAVRALEAACEQGELRPYDGETDLFIYPGYIFNVPDALLTNLHLPQSSLLMLVAAFAGTEFVLGAYAHAVEAGYRFFSYGDAMLIQNKHAV